MLSGPSALIAVEGRIEPVSTTGLSLFTTRCRKYDVSSSVSVPCVIATPSTSDFASSSFTRLRELQPDLVVHVLAADAGDLLAGDVGDVLQLRDRLDQDVDADGARLVAGVGLRRGGAGDGSAGGQDHDLGLLRRGRLSAGDGSDDQRRQTERRMRFAVFFMTSLPLSGRGHFFLY